MSSLSRPIPALQNDQVLTMARTNPNLSPFLLSFLALVFAFDVLMRPQYSGDPFPEPIRVSVGLIVTGLSGKIYVAILFPTTHISCVAISF